MYWPGSLWVGLANCKCAISRPLRANRFARMFVFMRFMASESFTTCLRWNHHAVSTIKENIRHHCMQQVVVCKKYNSSIPNETRFSNTMFSNTMNMTMTANKKQKTVCLFHSQCTSFMVTETSARVRFELLDGVHFWSSLRGTASRERSLG